MGSKSRIRASHPVDKANFFSFTTFSWMNDLMNSANKKKHLKPEDIPSLSEYEGAGRNAKELETLWSRECALSSKEPRLGHVLWLFCRRRVYLTTIIYLSSIVLGFIGPTLLMKQVLRYASSDGARREEGLLWVTLLILCEFGRVLLFTLTWALSYRTALRTKAGCMGLLYSKIFRLHGSLNDSQAAKMVNVISCDCGKIYDLLVLGQVAIGGPLVLLLSLAYILWELGPLALLGMAVFPLAYPLQYGLARWSGGVRKKGVEMKDGRVTLITQLLQHLKFIKMSRWETHFHRLVSESRKKELSYLRKSQLLQSWSVVLTPTLPHVGAIITFILYLSAGHSLTPPQCFTILFVFSLVGYSVRSVNQLAELWVNTRIAQSRIQGLLLLPEMHQESSTKTFDSCSEMKVIAQKVCLQRLHKLPSQKKAKNKGEEGSSVEQLLGVEGGPLAFELRNINVTIKKGSFVGICGAVGSGKSTFLEGLAGSIAPTGGRLDISGKVAYVAQTPWIFRGTLRENVVFGETFESLRYYEAIDACCLTIDFGILPLGDLTETDEKGSNLSGGQRLRLSLARAIYSFGREIFLLDDPFSGLDSRVCKTIFERVIKGLLLPRGKTVILASHQLHLLQECEDILLFGHETIAQHGTHSQLSASSPLFRLLLSNSINNNANVEAEDAGIVKETQKCLLSIGKKPNPLINDSLASKGHVPWEAYKLYMGGAGGMWAFVVVVFAFALSIGATTFSSWWLKTWFQSQPGNFSSTLDGDVRISMESQVINADYEGYDLYRSVYAGMIAIIFLASLFRTILFVWTCMKASKVVHNRMLNQLLSSTVKGVDRLGSGQLLNLFSRDIGEIDSSLPNTMEQFLQNVFILGAILFLVSLVFPLFLLPLALLALIFGWVRGVYNCAVRDLKRLEANANTPVFSSISETIAGLSTIRAYQKDGMLIQFFDQIVDTYHSVLYTYSGSIRWLSIRLDSLAVSVTGVTALLIVMLHGSVAAAAAGLALAYAAQFSGVFQFTVRLASETEAKFVSMERIQKFLTTTTSEEVMLDGDEKKGDISDDKMLPTWPYAGRVKFDAVVLSYSDNRPALNEVSFEVQPGQRIGIVGRTGSGKTSIGHALFRINELKSGQILIDDVDISKLSLPTLRQALSVLPQDPSVFQQSIRFNLDPGGESKDEELWGVIRQVGLASSVHSLDTEVNLSHGQQQLLSVARALLRNSKIVFVDEATSNVDVETSGMVDRLLASQFPDSTLFIVAHRLASIAHCHLILLLEDGKVRDFGTLDAVSKKPEFMQHFEKF